MTRKAAGLGDYVVAKLEGQYWDERSLRWRLLIRVPELVEGDDLSDAVRKLVAKGKGDACCRVALVDLHEGTAVQMLHVGHYEDEHESVETMRRFAGTHGWRPEGPQHDVYLSDSRRVAPDRLRTIVRLPVKKV